jgi:thioredoxin 1
MIDSNIIKVTDSNFKQEVLAFDLNVPVLVFFTAPWVATSNLNLVLEEIADSYQGQVKITKMNIITSPNTTVQYDVKFFPTIIVFKAGLEIQRIQGAIPKARLVHVLGL